MNLELLSENEILGMLSQKVMTWYQSLVKSIPNLVAAVIVTLTFLLIAQGLKKLAGRVFPKLTSNQSVISLFQTLIYAFVILMGLFISLEILNLEKTVTSILAGAGVIGLALGFAFQEIASNFVSGIFIAFRRPYRLGDYVEVDNFFGEVTDINLRTTSLTTFQGLEVLIPNKSMFTKAFINFTTTPMRRIDLSVGVSYSDDLEKVAKVTKDALEPIEQRVSSKEVDVFFHEFGDSSINFTVHLWIKYPEDKAFYRARHQAIIRIKKAFDEEGITIPFPIRTLDFDKSLKIEK